jgi:2-polyprenyl-3-methyl-5-hydroxy-6-metoxy-1,4-benzoquinol methylase
MTIEVLADLLKSRDCEAVCYFHTDHFEPWSTSIDDASARAVERMAQQARSSPYARRLSLFYNVFIPYRLEGDGPIEAGDTRAPGDGVVFNGRSAHQEKLTREVVRPLVTADGHEMHLHVHHEFWTRNTSHFDHPVSRWVNACSTPEADRARLDLHFMLSKEAIAREIGAPFERWAFIHGNWALNASDPLICHVTDEMAMIMRHGGFGDFSFPAGRSYCDPKLETPFTCRPVDLWRAYDDPRADPRPIGSNTRVLRPDRFFIWNSPIKSVHSSLDYYSAANRKLFKTPERVVATWLSKSVRLDRKLFIKTHAHSMKTEYRLAEPDSTIPHCHPDVVAIFEHLARACDRAKIELRLQTVNEVVDLLSELDGSPKASMLTPSVSEPSSATSMVSAVTPPSADTSDFTPAEANLPPTTPRAMAAELLDLHRVWMAGEGAQLPSDDLYQTKVGGSTSLEIYEMAIALEIADRYPAGATRVVEIGCGWGGLAILLARMGFEVFGFEGNLHRHTACQWHFEEQIRRFPILRDRLNLAPVGLFPEIFAPDALSRDKINLCIATNITSTYSAEHQQVIARAAAECDELILDLGRFGQARDSQAERDALFESLRTINFKPIERLFFQDPYEYWRFRSRAILPARRRPSPAAPAVTSLQRAPTTRFPLAESADASQRDGLFSFFGSQSLRSLVTLISRRPPPPTAPAFAPSERAMATHFPATSRSGPLFSVFGDQELAECPVCQSADIAPLWRMPATTLPEPIKVFGGYFDQIPTLQVPGILFCFDLCHTCESIFLNPVLNQKQGYRTSDHYIRKMTTPAEWKDYEELYDDFSRWIPSGATVMLDAACGIGQYLHLARRDSRHQWRRLVGLELAEKYVEHMRSEGLDAHVFDIDNDDLHRIVPADSVDFISFCEAFEHVERPLDALRKLLTVLRPGGRLYFTAQRYGADVQAAVRPGEPIYIGEKTANELPQHLHCRVISKKTSTMRYYVVLEK